MNFTKLKEKNRGVTTALVQMAVMATSFSASAATAAYYVGRRGNYGTSGSKNYLVDPALPGISKDLFKYRKVNPIKEKSKKICAEDLTIHTNAISELLIVDQNIKDYRQFSRLMKPGVALVEIPQGVDGFTFMLKSLAKYQHLKAVHLFSHANAGELLLGNTLVDSKTLGNHAAFAKVVNGAVKTGGDFLLYGCELGKGEKGDEFLQIIKGKTHVDVAASSNLTGNVAFKGDWELEVKKGNIEAKPLANSIAMRDFTEVLQNITFQVGSWTVVNAGAGNDRFTPQGSNKSSSTAIDASVKQTVSGIERTLKVDGAYNSIKADNSYGISFGFSEKALTISFVDGSAFKPVSIEVYAYQGDLATITTNNGGSVNANIKDASAVGYSNQTFDLSTLPAGATSLTITNNSWAPFVVNTNSGFMGAIKKITFASINTPVLPVQLVDFSVKANHNGVALLWQTVAESNNKKFVIYRGDDEKVFKELVSIDGAGNSAALKNYSYVDKKPLQGNNYYKLVQVDNDGKETELSIKSVVFDLKSQATIYPNPTSDRATIAFEADKYHSLSLSGLDGKELVIQKLSASQIEAVIDLSSYAKGIYFVKLNGADGSVVHKVLKK
ncbi:hypothetical protein D3C87_418220 [compost metagenome]